MLTTRDYLSAKKVPGDHRIPYGSAPAQFGDLFLPSTPGPHPVVVLLHGGCWLSEYPLEPISGLARSLSDDLGVAVWNLEYRKVGEPGGGWPGTFHDVAAGIDFLAELAKRFPLQLETVVAGGHSAGGHLALWAAARSRLPKGSALASPVKVAVTRVVALAGIADLSAGAEQNLCEGAVRVLLQGLDPDRLASASPASLLPLSVPQVLITGKKDSIVPADYVRRYAGSARRAGDPVTVIELDDAGHFEVVTPGSEAYPAVRQAFRGR